MTSNGLAATLRECLLLNASHPSKDFAYSLQPCNHLSRKAFLLPSLNRGNQGAERLTLPGGRATGQILCYMCIEGQSQQYGRCHRSCLERVLPEGPHPSWRSEPLIG